MTGRKKRLAIFLCLAMLLSVCTPLVTSAAVIPTVGAAVSANNSVKVVSTQAQLNSALTMSGVKQIVIRTDKAAAFEIPKGNYSAKKLVIRAPKAEIENAGTFRSVTIYSVSDQAYTENADHNKIRILASGGKIVVPAGRTADSLSVVRKNSRVKIVVSGTVQQMDVKKASNLALEVTGSIKKMNVNATSTITVTGDSKDTTIIVNKAARNSRITVSAPATVKLKAATTVTLKKGAENAKLVIPKSSAKAVSYTLVNETDSTLKLNTSSGTKTLANGKSYDGKESGSSGTIITGGGSGGSSGGSGGGNGGGTSKPVEPEKPPVTKKSVPVAAEITGVNSFCVYVDAVEQIDTLKVAISPSIGAITSKGAVSAQTKVFYAKDGKPLHVYGYCYEYATEKAFEQNQEYTVSVEETDQYCFSFKDSTVTAELPEQKTKDEVELEAYADKFKREFDGMWISIGTAVDNDILAEAIKKKPSTSNPTLPLGELWEKFKKDGGTIDKVLIQEDVKANKAYPVDITIKRNDIEKTFTCIIGSFDYTTDEGKFLDAKYYIQCRQWNVNVEGECVLNENTTLMPSGVTIVGWQSSITHFK